VAQLPRTGGTPWIPFAGTGILALAFITRRTVVRARQTS
jgi:LPXTG-motif cell wall-anchored protein